MTMHPASHDNAASKILGDYAHPSHRSLPPPRRSFSDSATNASSSSETEGREEANPFDIYGGYPGSPRQPEEHPAVALRVMLLVVWLVLSLLAVLDQIGIDVDMWVR
jgi:hypothetical protein